MKKVLTYGTFDLFHVGHVRLLKRVRALGDYLVVGCSTDEFNTEKGKSSVFSYRERKEILESCKYVDEVIPEDRWEQKRADIQERGISIFAMGEDWAGKFDDLADSVQVVYLPRTRGISSTDLKKVVSLLQKERTDELRNALQHALELAQQL